jgi:hypothetical protein
MADAFQFPPLVSTAAASSGGIAGADAGDGASSNPNTKRNTTTTSWREASAPRLPQHYNSHVPQQQQPQQSPATSTKDSFWYVGIHLKRPPMQKSWGLALSMLEGMILLGDVNLNTNTNTNRNLPPGTNTNTNTCTNTNTQWVRVIACQNQAQVGQHYHHLQYLNQQGLVWYFGQQQAASPQTTTAVEPHHRQLCPGDLLVAVNGFSARQFGSLQSCTDCIRYSNEVTLVVLRHSRAQTAARNIIWRNATNTNARSGNPNPNPHPQAPLQATLAALPLWKEYFYNQNKSNNNNNNNTTITRQVTPDHPSMMARPSSASCYPSPQLQALHLLSSLASRITTTTTTPHPSVPIQSSNTSTTPSAPPPPFFISKKRKYRPKPPNHLKSSLPRFVLPDSWKNSWFRQENGGSLPFSDNWEFSPQEGSRSSLFLPPMNQNSSQFQTWLQQRKATWRAKYQVYQHPDSDLDEVKETSEEVDEEVSSTVVSKDFWRTSQGLDSWEDWLTQSVTKWKFGYSWNRAKRQRIQQECEEVVHLTTPNNNNLNNNFDHWLHIRKKQWVVLRRKRQRKRKGEEQAETEAKFKEEEVVEPMQSPQATSSADVSSTTTKTTLESPAAPALATNLRRNLRQLVASNDLVFIDDMLEQEERRRKALLERPPIDISFLFDANKGAPDDVVVHCLLFLSPSEHTKLLCISYTTALALKARNDVWRQLCPKHWVLPRRPRKPWHELYRYMLSRELRDSRKLWDDLLLKCATVLLKGDHLQKIEKLVQTGTAGFGFEVNYISPVVCERNSLLNMAVIHQRHKIVRWLVVDKRAELESYDRGQFTPLLNAAWAGDRYLVRFLLQRGSDRTKVGTGHSSAGLAAPHFKGLTAEGWARKKGHEEIAKLIRVGL